MFTMKYGLQYLGKDCSMIGSYTMLQIDADVVAVTKDSGKTVGHLPRKISRLCSMFVEQGGDITCVVMGNRRYSSDLGLEISCTLIFYGK